MTREKFFLLTLNRLIDDKLKCCARFLVKSRASHLNIKALVIRSFRVNETEKNLLLYS